MVRRGNEARCKEQKKKRKENRRETHRREIDVMRDGVGGGVVEGACYFLHVCGDGGSDGARDKQRIINQVFGAVIFIYFLFFYSTAARIH